MFRSLPPKAVIVVAMILASLIAMGLYQFHQRIYFREVAVRVTVGVAAGCLVLAALFYELPMVMISRDVKKRNSLSGWSTRSLIIACVTP